MQKTCANEKCRNVFNTEYFQKEYCSIRCRRTAKENRAVNRDITNGHRQAPTETETEAIMYFIAPITNPTADLLTKIAALLVAAKATKPVLFRAQNMPIVEFPPEITFSETVVKGEWLMFYETIVYAPGYGPI